MWPDRRNDRPTLQDIQEESDEEAFHGANAPVGLLLFAPFYAADQRSSAMRPPCDCTEEFDISPRILTDVSMNDDPNVSEAMNADARTSTPRAREPHFDAEMSPILVPKAKKRIYRNLTRRKLVDPEPPLVRRRLGSHKLPTPSTAAILVANRIIKYARRIRNMHEKEMWCLSCGLLPTDPVTGQCGHTRCSTCIKINNKCPCGDNFPDSLNFNILIRNLVGKATCDSLSSGSNVSLSSDVDPDGYANDHDPYDPEKPFSGDAQGFEEASSSSGVPIRVSAIEFNVGGPDVSANEALIHPAGVTSASCSGRLASNSARISSCKRPVPMSPRARYNHAVELLSVGRHLDAAPHLALVAASDHMDFRHAHNLLTRVLTLLIQDRDAKTLTVILNRCIHRLSSTSWLKLSDLECILCCDVFAHPVTTPCGHMFCRTCLERTLDYRKRCPLCLHSLRKFNLYGTATTTFMEGALKSLNANVAALPLESDLIPIIACTVAFPSVPCPLFIFDPRYWLMIRRVIESGSRKFGMVGRGRGKDNVDYGTILEVRDCVHLEDGRSILSTVGLSRFKIIERCVRDGCEVARIMPIIDVIPGEMMEVRDIKKLGRLIIFEALVWLSELNDGVLDDIEDAFGRMPLNEGHEEDWWKSQDGPAWLWWLIAVLPLRSEIKLLIHSTDSLLKRMRAVRCTLESVKADEILRGPFRG